MAAWQVRRAAAQVLLMNRRLEELKVRRFSGKLKPDVLTYLGINRYSTFPWNRGPLHVLLLA